MAPAATALKKPAAVAKRSPKPVSPRDREVAALARKMADEELEGLAQELLRELVAELRALNAEIAAQKW